MDKKAIYIINNCLSPHLKIGMSKNPIQRVKQMTSNTGINMNVVYSTELLSNPSLIEQRIHSKFEEYRISGEWFNIDLKKAKDYILSIYNSFEGLERIEPIHSSVKQKKVKEVKEIPTDVEVINKYVAKDDKSYFIKYNFLGSIIILSIPYEEMIEDYFIRLRGMLVEIV